MISGLITRCAVDVRSFPKGALITTVGGTSSPSHQVVEIPGLGEYDVVDVPPQRRGNVFSIISGRRSRDALIVNHEHSPIITNPQGKGATFIYRDP